MSVPFQRRSPGKGSPPMAEEWNGFIEAYQAYRSGTRFDFDSATGTPSQTIAKVRNLTGGDLPRFAVVELGEFLVGSSPNFSEFAAKMSFEGSAPTEATGNRIGILWDPIGEDAVGRAVVAGAVPCLVDVTDENHWFAGAIAGDTTGLESFVKGPVAILWKEPGLGPRWAVVRLGSGAKASKSDAPDVAYVEYASREPSAAYPELYPALWFERNLDADGSVEWVPTASWAHMANQKLPTMQHLYPAFQVDNQLLIEEKPTYTTEGNCCDDDIPNPYYSGSPTYGPPACPQCYEWSEELQRCVYICDGYVSPECCVGVSFPETLLGTVLSTTRGDCGCVLGSLYALVYDAAYWATSFHTVHRWNAVPVSDCPSSTCSDNLAFWVECSTPLNVSPPEWEWHVSGNAAISGTIECDPFSMDVVVDLADGGGGTMTVRITG